MTKEFYQHSWDERVAESWRRLLRLALEEDLGSRGDLTSAAVVPAGTVGRAAIVARAPGVVAGLPAVELTFQTLDPSVRLTTRVADGQLVGAGEKIALIEGSARTILAAERLILNVLGRLSGIATLTRRFVEAVGGTRARIYDTRKTTPGWRALEKYAVRCGGGLNHRTGLFDAVLIKDNHLALWSRVGQGCAGSLFAAVQAARQYLSAQLDTAQNGDTAKNTDTPQNAAKPPDHETIIEVEVDSLAQLAEVLPASPDVVLLDNMTIEALRQAVAIRDAVAPAVQLEASGGIELGNVRAIAETGVERISVGAITHSAPALNISLDWL